MRVISLLEKMGLDPRPADENWWLRSLGTSEAGEVDDTDELAVCISREIVLGQRFE